MIMPVLLHYTHTRTHAHTHTLYLDQSQMRLRYKLFSHNPPHLVVLLVNYKALLSWNTFTTPAVHSFPLYIH